MKKLVSLTSIALMAMVLILINTGCVSTQHITTFPDGSSVTNTTTKLDPTRTAKAIKNILPPAVTFAVNQEPAARGYIEKAQVAICAAASAGKFSPDELKAAIDATGIKEIQTPEVEAAIQSIYGIYAAYYGDIVAAKLDQNEWLVPVLSAICDGLKEGLAAVPSHQPIATAPSITIPIGSTGQ